MERKARLRFTYEGAFGRKLEVLDDDGNVVQSLPVKDARFEYYSSSPGTAEFSLHCDLVELVREGSVL